MNLIYFLLIGLCAGWLAGQITKRGSFGLLRNLIIGVVGAILGGFVFDILGFERKNTLGNLITATVGAVLLLWLLQKLEPRRKRRR